MKPSSLTLLAVVVAVSPMACGSSDSDSGGGSGGTTSGGGSSGTSTGGKSAGGTGATVSSGGSSSGGTTSGGSAGVGGSSGGSAGGGGAGASGGTAGAAGASGNGGSGGSSSNGFRYMTWNLQHGEGTDNVYNPSRQADEILKHNPDVVCLNEANPGPQADLPAALQAKSGKTWNKVVNGDNDMILSPHALSNGAGLQYASAYCGTYGAVRAVVDIDGTPVTIGCTHLTVLWGTCTATASQVATARAAEVDELKGWIQALPAPRAIAGDMNAQHETGEMAHFSNATAGAYDNAWMIAIAAGTAKAYPDNPPVAATRTRKTDIDHVFFSKGSLSISGALVPDIRDMTKPVANVKDFLDASKGCPNYATKNYGYPEDCFVRSSDHQPKIVDFVLP